MLDIPAFAWRYPIPHPMWRVARDPEALPRVRPSSGPTHRFDDPDQEYSVRYLADSLDGCLIETLQRFRPPHPSSIDIDARLAAVTNIDGRDHQPSLTNGLRIWLDEQCVGKAHAIESADRVVILASAFDQLCDDGRVLSAWQSQYPDEPHLDLRHILSGGANGRPITQAISRTIYQAYERPAGIEYPSRRALDVTCWAIYDRTPMHFDVVERLDRHNPIHLSAVHRICHRYTIEMPTEWC